MSALGDHGLASRPQAREPNRRLGTARLPGFCKSSGEKDTHPKVHDLARSRGLRCHYEDTRVRVKTHSTNKYIL